MFVAFLVYLCLASPAFANVKMSDQLCTQSSGKNMTISALLKTGKSFDCSSSKYDVDGPRTWVRIPFLDGGLPDGPVEVQADNNGLTTMRVHSVLDDGQILTSHFSAQDVQAHWRPKGRYGLPVPGTDKPGIRSHIQTVYVAIDDMKVTPSISLLELASTEKWDALQLPLLVMFAALCGMAIMPLIYHMFFYGALGYSFMPWHSLMIGAAVTYTFSSSGLIFVAFPETSLATKMLINYWAPAVAVAACGFFLVSFIERDKIERWLQITIYWTAMLPIIVTALAIRVDETSTLEARNYYHAAFLPIAVVISYTMGHALRRGSKAIWFQIAGWTPILCFVMDRVARGVDLYIGWAMLDYGMYFLLVVESIVLALGVAYRILRLRQNHEVTLRKQTELTLLADTDGLTMMNNRRSFEREFRRNQKDLRYSHLALFDIDFFKRVNDRYGHEIGDKVLRVVGRELDATPHFAARIGGEEFTLLIQNDAAEDQINYPVNALTEICEHLIKTVHEKVPQIQEAVTFSVGVAAISRRDSLRTVMAIADGRLYHAKHKGRNQIVWIDLSDPLADKPAGMMPG
ncbi:MAG: hypothetical protein COA41_06370 [Sphingopyxis sp.]|nr:MAG: hypothetical protein COA41_06370 [Sphingopyxis sp.]